MNAKQLLGIDVGEARIGVARASSVASIAEPLVTIETSKAIEKLNQLVSEHSVDTIVVGLPRNLRGDDTKQTNWVRDWVRRAQADIKAQFYWQDEALTSHIAEVASLSHKKPKDIDALAAAIILQDFLDTPEAERVVC